MNSTTELENAYNQVLQKIGRNLLLFQQAELLIKRLRSIGTYSARPGEAYESIEKRASTCEKMTLGQVVNLFVDNHCIGESSAPVDCTAGDSGPDSGEARFSIHFTLGGTEGYPEARKQALAEMVAERNELVHHLLLKLDRDSLESCLQVCTYLDEQRQKILPEIRRLQEDLKNVREDLETILNHLVSQKGMEQLYLPEIKRSSLITNLADIARENPDPEAWTPLGPATKRLQDFPPEKITSLLAQFGMTKLTQLLDASQRFDIEHEQLKHGKHRAVYRLKQHQTTSPFPVPDTRIQDPVCP
jgi:hypothetical protein